MDWANAAVDNAAVKKRKNTGHFFRLKFVILMSFGKYFAVELPENWP
nr:hypothetical protein [uncultured bacterium]